MPAFHWDAEANVAANRILSAFQQAHRGAILWRATGLSIVFGNDGYGKDRALRDEVANVRTALLSAGITELGFGTSGEDDYTWAMIVRSHDTDLLSELVWRAWFSACGPVGADLPDFPKKYPRRVFDNLRPRRESIADRQRRMGTDSRLRIVPRFATCNRESRRRAVRRLIRVRTAQFLDLLSGHLNPPSHLAGRMNPVQPSRLAPDRDRPRMPIQEGGSGSSCVATVASLTRSFGLLDSAMFSGVRLIHQGAFANRLNPVQFSVATPTDHRRHVAAQQLGHGSGRVAAIASLSLGTESRMHGASVLDPIGRAGRVGTRSKC